MDRRIADLHPQLRPSRYRYCGINYGSAHQRTLTHRCSLRWRSDQMAMQLILRLEAYGLSAALAALYGEWLGVYSRRAAASLSRARYYGFTHCRKLYGFRPTAQTAVHLPFSPPPQKFSYDFLIASSMVRR